MKPNDSSIGIFILPQLSNMANRFGLTYSAQPEAPLSPRVFAILNNTYQDSPIMPLLGESIIQQKDKEEAAARKRDREEREIAKAEKKAKVEYIKNGCGHQNLFNFFKPDTSTPGTKSASTE